jgi:hypothetical protein
MGSYLIENLVHVLYKEKLKFVFTVYKENYVAVYYLGEIQSYLLLSKVTPVVGLCSKVLKHSDRQSTFTASNT